MSAVYEVPPELQSLAAGGQWQQLVQALDQRAAESSDASRPALLRSAAAIAERELGDADYAALSIKPEKEGNIRLA